ncbi:hypothetical protein DL767_007744 [Monosporascus sp. MG133]|nr:hypothetical protein DL767_007744 [Monosporascus sp. MG133]
MTETGSIWMAEWAAAQKFKAPSMKNESVFYRNLEEELDLARQTGNSLPLHLPNHEIDFSSCDVIGLGHSGALRKEFLQELADNPNFQLGACGSRLMDGHTRYQDKLEREIAEMFDVESALVVHSGWTANEAIFSTIPRPGDVIVYDELMHATALAGMKVSLALEQRPFRHNDVDSFIEVLEEVRDSQPQIRSGKRCVIIAVESYYSMDGDICPLRELIDAAKDIFPLGNAEFVVDEAHSFGVIGPKGLGFVSELGLEKEIAIRMNTFGKALAGSGAVILSNNTVRSMLINNAKVLICSVAPPFTLLAAARVGHRLMQSEEGQKVSASLIGAYGTELNAFQARDRLQYLTKLYLDTLTSNPIYKKANAKGLLRMPTHEDEDWHDQPFITHIVPIWTKSKYAHYLSFHLVSDGINGTPIVFPIVPKGEDRVRLIMHSYNTEEEVKTLANSICSWAQEMLEIEASGDKNRLPKAAQRAFDLMKKAAAEDGVNGTKGTNGVNGTNGPKEIANGTM